jgi:hypothetical protein
MNSLKYPLSLTIPFHVCADKTVCPPISAAVCLFLLIVSDHAPFLCQLSVDSKIAFLLTCPYNWPYSRTNTPQPWRWRRYVPLKRRCMPTNLHSANPETTVMGSRTDATMTPHIVKHNCVFYVCMTTVIHAEMKLFSSSYRNRRLQENRVPLRKIRCIIHSSERFSTYCSVASIASCLHYLCPTNAVIRIIPVRNQWLQFQIIGEGRGFISSESSTCSNFCQSWNETNEICFPLSVCLSNTDCIGLFHCFSVLPWASYDLLCPTRSPCRIEVLWLLKVCWLGFLFSRYYSN